jgi:hypothetical protein
MSSTDRGHGSEGRETGHGSRARGLVWAVVVAALTLFATPSSSMAAEPPGTILSADSATLISAVIPAQTNSTYRSFLPSGIAPPPNRSNPSNPNRPSLKLTGLDLAPTGIPFSVYENYAMVRSRYCGMNGWYNQGDGANSPAVKPLGDALGISKFTIDPESSLGRDADDRRVWKSRARLDGKPLVTMTWRKDPARLAELLRKQPWQHRWLRGSGAPFEAPIWDAFPVPGQEGQISWIDANSADSIDPPQWTNRVGVVRVKVRQGVDPSRTNGDWMSLVPKTVEVPGVLQNFDQGTSYVTLRREALGAC